MPRFAPTAAAFACLALFAGLPTFADVQPTDDVGDAATIQTDDGVRFTVPAKVRPDVAYHVRARFDSEYEQTVTLYEWVLDADQTGHWQRRAFYNTYMQGREIDAEIPLASGRTYLLAAHHKHVRSPGYGQPWSQSRLATNPAPAAAGDAPPTLAAHFDGARGAAVDVSLVPLPPSPAAVQ